MRFAIGLICASLMISRGFAADNDPTLTIQIGGEKKTFRRSVLLKRKDLSTLEVPADPGYGGKKMRYRGVPAHSLFQGLEVPADATIQFKCLDGFSGPMDRGRLLNSDPAAAIAYLAIEGDVAWPALDPPKDQRTPSPFYLVWLNPEKSQINREEWPMQLSGFEVQGTLASAFPAIQPVGKFGDEHPVRRGLRVFARTCFTCHTLNQQGKSQMGPDLNFPHSPTEYFTEPTFKAYVRNPQSLRHWPQAKMPPFTKDVLPDTELADLITYLRHMSRHRPRQ